MEKEEANRWIWNSLISSWKAIVGLFKATAFPIKPPSVGWMRGEWQLLCDSEYSHSDDRRGHFTVSPIAHSTQSLGWSRRLPKCHMLNLRRTSIFTGSVKAWNTSFPMKPQVRTWLGQVEFGHRKLQLLFQKSILATALMDNWTEHPCLAPWLPLHCGF